MQRVEGRIELVLPDERLAEALEKALRVEALNPPDPHRGEARVERRGSTVLVSFRARDLSSARALLNAFLTLAATVVDSIEASKS